MAGFGNIGGGLGTRALFTGIGATEGASDKMLYNEHLEDAMDMTHQQTWDKTNADEALDKAKTDQSIRYLNAVRGDDGSAQVNKTQQARYGAPDQSQMPQGGQQPQPPMPGAQPSAMPMQGQQQPSQAPQGAQPQPDANNAPIQPRTATVTPPQGPTPMPQSLQVNGQANPDGRAQPQSQQGTDQTAPPVGDRATNAPSEKAAMTGAIQQAATSGDPFDINYAKAGIVVNENTGEHHWVQENADMYKFLHDTYPNLSDTQRLALTGDFASGNWKGTEKEPARQVFLDHVAKLDDQAAHYEGGPQDVGQMAPADKQYMDVQKNLGLSNATSLQPLRPAEQTRVAGLMKDSSALKTNATAGINSMNSLLSSMGVDNAYGPLAGTEAKLKTAWANMSNTQVSSAVDNWWVQNKNTIQAANANLRAMPGGRLGVGFLNKEIQGVPSAEMSPNAEKEMILQYLSNYTQGANYADALMDGPENANVAMRTSHANAYMEHNPAMGTDGKTANPNYQQYNDWMRNVAGGQASKGPTATQVRSDSLNNASGGDVPAQQVTSGGKSSITKGKDGKFQFSGF